MIFVGEKKIHRVLGLAGPGHGGLGLRLEADPGAIHSSSLGQWIRKMFGLESQSSPGRGFRVRVTAGYSQHTVKLRLEQRSTVAHRENVSKSSCVPLQQYFMFRDLDVKFDT